MDVDVQYDPDPLAADFCALMQQLDLGTLGFELQSRVTIVVEDSDEFRCEAIFGVVRISRGFVVGTAMIASAWLGLYRAVVASLPADGRVTDLTCPELAGAATQVRESVLALLTGHPATAPANWGTDVLGLRLVSGMWLTLVLHELAHLRAQELLEGPAEEIECDRLACEALVPLGGSALPDVLLGLAAGFMLLLIWDVHQPRQPTTHPPALERVRANLSPRLGEDDQPLWAFIGFVASLHIQAVGIEPIQRHQSLKEWAEYCISSTFPQQVDRSS
ncbi:MAG TPA: hypothetical protein VN999_18005 [Thermoanaerobaculia bacterium]|nr:hypothetical protein [Thermoanaerobaculia bacterium]